MSISPIADLSADRRRALALLEWYGDGSTELLLLARGFTDRLIADLLDAGLASTIIERMDYGRHPIEVRLVRITEAGRRLLSDES